MTTPEPPEPLCFDCAFYPEPRADLEESAPDRAGRSVTGEFFCPRIRRPVTPTFATHCAEYQEPPEDLD